MPDPTYPVSLLQLLAGIPSQGARNPYPQGQPSLFPAWWNLPGMSSQQRQPQDQNQQARPGLGPYPDLGNPVRPNPGAASYNLNWRPDLTAPQPPQDTAQTPPQTPQQPRSPWGDPRTRLQMGMFGLNMLGPTRYF